MAAPNDPALPPYLRGCLSRTALSLLATVAMFAALGVAMVGLALIPERLVPRDIKPFLLVGCLLAAGLAVGGAMLAWVLADNARVYARFDAAFASLGLTRTRYLLSGLQYHGQAAGRPAAVYYHVSGGRYLRTPDLQVGVGGRIGTRLGLGPANALTRLGAALLQRQALDLPDPAYLGVSVYSLDEAWARRLLMEPTARAAALRLAGPGLPGVRTLVLTPEMASFHWRHFELAAVTPEAARQWLADLTVMAEAAESLPAPTQTAPAGRWDRPEPRGGPSSVLLPALLITGVLLAGACALTLVLVSLNGGF